MQLTTKSAHEEAFLALKKKKPMHRFTKASTESFSFSKDRISSVSLFMSGMNFRYRMLISFHQKEWKKALSSFKLTSINSCVEFMNLFHQKKKRKALRSFSLVSMNSNAKFLNYSNVDFMN